MLTFVRAVAFNCLGTIVALSPSDAQHTPLMPGGGAGLLGVYRCPPFVLPMGQQGAPPICRSLVQVGGAST